MGRESHYFLVERYVPSIAAPAVATSVERLNAAVTGDTRHLITLLVPREETCLSVFQAADAEAVGAANSAAGFDVDRVVEVQVFPGPETPDNHEHEWRGDSDAGH